MSTDLVFCFKLFFEVSTFCYPLPCADPIMTVDERPWPCQFSWKTLDGVGSGGSDQTADLRVSEEAIMSDELVTEEPVPANIAADRQVRSRPRQPQASKACRRKIARGKKGANKRLNFLGCDEHPDRRCKGIDTVSAQGPRKS